MCVLPEIKIEHLVYITLKMESIKQLRKGKDYNLLFDPRSYLEAYYKQVEGPAFIQFVVESLHKIYATGKVANLLHIII